MARQTRQPPEKIDIGISKDLALQARVYSGIAAGFLLIAALGGWAANAELSGAVVAAGQVKVDKDLRSIQHLDGGIIKSINVRKGAVVKEGDTLFTLDSTQTTAELQIVRSQMVELISKQARLSAESQGLDYMLKVQDNLDLGINGSEVFAGEVRLFKGNFQARSSQKKQIELSIAQLEQEINGLNAQAEANKSELELVQAEFNKVKDLYDRKLLDGSRMLSNQRDLTRLLGDKGNIQANIARSLARHNELEVNLKSVDENARTEAQKQLSEVEPRIAELGQRQHAILDRMSRLEIKAPISGTINEIAVNTIGGVITPAQKLVTVVPADAKLQIEVKLQTTDIDQVYVGQDAKLRFSAFTSRETPELKGKVVFLSPATTTDEATGQSFYVAQVEPLPGEESKLQGKSLVPGMPVEAFVQTESRTALSYLAKPFVDQFTRAFRE